jgi:hypothetical protein
MDNEIKSSDTQKIHQSPSFRKGLAIGTALGVGIGVAMHTLAIGIGIGVALGFALGLIMDRKQKNNVAQK